MGESALSLAMKQHLQHSHPGRERKECHCMSRDCPCKWEQSHVVLPYHDIANSPHGKLLMESPAASPADLALVSEAAVAEPPKFPAEFQEDTGREAVEDMVEDTTPCTVKKGSKRRAFVGLPPEVIEQ